MLCGGTSRRMGRPKAFLRGPDGLTLLERTVALLHQAGCYPLAIAIAPGQPMPIWSSAPLVYPSPAVAIDHAPGLGPLAGILAGMEWAAAHHPHAGWILTAPADVPFLPLDLTVRLCGHMHVPEPDVLMVRHGRRREHTIAVWSVKLAADLRRALLEEGVRRVEEFARRYAFAELVWPGGAASFLNVNTPAEFAKATRLAASSLRDRGLSKR